MVIIVGLKVYQVLRGAFMASRIVIVCNRQSKGAFKIRDKLKHFIDTDLTGGTINRDQIPLIINWGCSSVLLFNNLSCVLNSPEKVKLSISKKYSFEKFKQNYSYHIDILFKDDLLKLGIKL